MKSTPFTSIHEALGAKMAAFAGYNMPITYSSILEEHTAVRERAGVFDVSHMGEFIVEGPNASQLVQKISSNDISKLVPGKAQYSCMPNNEGGIVDDLIIYKLEKEKYMLVVNAANIEKDYAWIAGINKNIVAGLKDVSGETALLAVQGPKATTILQELTDVDLSGIKFYTFEKGVFAGVPNVLLSATGYTGSGGFELYFEDKGDNATKIWDAIFEAGKPYDIKPAGLAARDTLRLEMGFCLYGNDIDDHTSPLEAGLGWITKFTESNDFVNRPYFEKQKEDGLTRKLVAFEMIERGIPRKDYPILDTADNRIGHVTSGTLSPYINKAIGLGYVATEHASVDKEIFIEVRNKKPKARIVKLPFYKPEK